MTTNIYYLDLIGVFSFAFFGAYVGLSKKFDLFGIFVCALLTSLGGGTIREIILNKIPVYLTDYHYFSVVIFGMIASIIFYNHFNKIKKYFLVVDAIGLSTFAFIGAQRADVLHLTNIAIVFFAVITAVAGGILRDIAVREVPYIFQKDFYASTAIVLGVIYALFRTTMHIPVAGYILLFTIFLLRLIAIRFRFRLWSRKG